MGNNLPKGWILCPLRDVVSSRKGKKPATAVDHEKKGYDPYILIDELEGKPVRAFTNDPKVPRSNKKDVLLVWDGSIGKCASGISGAVGSTIVVLSPKSGLNAKFLEYFIRRSKNYILETSTGTGLQHINKNFLKALEIPLPPDETDQKRIADKLDVLLAKVKDAQSRLDKIPLILKRFRQSVLSAAFSGKLTEEWRKKILVSKTQKTRNDTADLPEIPESWQWIKLPGTGEMNRGKSRHRPRNEPSLFGGSYPFIQTGDIAQSGGRISSHKQTYNEKGLAQSRLWPTGTICITIAANIAESAILTYPACFPDSVVGIIVNPKVCISEYIEYFIRVAKADLAMFATATAQKNINIGILNEVLVPLPLLAEQNEIARRIKSLFKLADQIETRYSKAKAEVEKLEQSILTKAFNGSLTVRLPNHPPKRGKVIQQSEQSIEKVAKLFTEGCCIFVGAGVPNNISFSLWDDLANALVEFTWANKDKLHRKLGISFMDELKIFIKNGRSIEVITNCKDIFVESDMEKEYQDKIKTLFDDDKKCQKSKYNDAYIELFNLAGKSFFIQTNLDRSLEVCKQMRCYLNTALPENIHSTTHPFLVYLHGIATNPTTWILTSDEYIRFYNKNESFQKFLRNLLQTHDIIFLGYSLIQDRALLESIAKFGNSKKTRLLILDKRDRNIYAEQIEDSNLRHYGIEVVRYSVEKDGYDAFVHFLKKVSASIMPNVHSKAPQQDGRYLDE